VFLKRDLDGRVSLLVSQLLHRGGPRVMLLCGADLVESFAAPGVWREEHLRRILGPDHGVVCIARRALPRLRCALSPVLASRQARQRRLRGPQACAKPAAPRFVWLFFFFIFKEAVCSVRTRA